MGMESHNHQPAIEPYGGAGTGIGGIIRDIISMELGLLLVKIPPFRPHGRSKVTLHFEYVVKGSQTMETGLEYQLLVEKLNLTIILNLTRW